MKPLFVVTGPKWGRDTRVYSPYVSTYAKPAEQPQLVVLWRHQKSARTRVPLAVVVAPHPLRVKRGRGGKR